jgi:monofunctional biosynthetic peptidoglycan transglycosylase
VRRLFRWLGRFLLAIVALWLLLALAYRWIDPPGTPLMLLRWPVVAKLDYRPVAFQRLAPALAEAVVASEDEAFCTHHGVDFNQVDAALQEFERRHRLRGASTITMQTARNLFLWPGGGVFRKALEVPLAYLLEALMSKRRIMTLYLNVIEWGDGSFGAEAAAERYFRTDAAHLDRREAALLAAVLPNPNRMSPARPSAYVRERAAEIEGRVARLEGLTGCLR